MATTATTISTSTHEIGQMREKTVICISAIAGEEAPELIAQIDHRYATTLASWESCVDAIICAWLRTRYARS